MLRALPVAADTFTSPTSDLLRVTTDAITGLRVEWWRRGPAASERERLLTACHEPGGVIVARGSQTWRVWSGPGGEHVEVDGAVTLRYRPHGDEPSLLTLVQGGRRLDPRVVLAMTLACVIWKAA